MFSLRPFRSLQKAGTALPIRVVIHEYRPLKQAFKVLNEQTFKVLNEQIRRQAIDDRIRYRRWGIEHYQKPGYVRRQEKFFAKVLAKKAEWYRRATGERYPMERRS
jgi:hypothetical protein